MDELIIDGARHPLLLLSPSPHSLSCVADEVRLIQLEFI